MLFGGTISFNMQELTLKFRNIAVKRGILNRPKEILFNSVNVILLFSSSVGWEP